MQFISICLLITSQLAFSFCNELRSYTKNPNPQTDRNLAICNGKLLSVFLELLSALRAGLVCLFSFNYLSYLIYYLDFV
jgi:hypothetical protein